MKIYEKKEVTITQETLIKIVCDICGREIDDDDYCFEVTTGHHDWGNDSCDSVEEKQICSDECLQREFIHYLCDPNDTKYLRIEHDYIE